MAKGKQPANERAKDTKALPLGLRTKEAGPSQRNMVFSTLERNYDALDAVQSLKSFNAFLRNVIARYDENARLLEEAEARETDLKHCMELSEGLTEQERRMIFRRLTEALRTRRTCKTENEILAPLYSYISDKTLINKLGQIQGAISTVKNAAGIRSYGCRTSVLDDFRQDEPEVKDRGRKEEKNVR